MKTYSANRRLRAVLMGCVFTGAVATAAPVMAQDNDDEPSDVTEVVVTGSRMRGVAPVGSTIISLGRQELEKSPAVTVDRMIKEVPQVFDLGVSESSRGQNGGGGNVVMGNSVNLRGIGPYATLILVDGHRAVNNGRSFDPSVIPSLGVERIEVMADGASAIYGSDAVAGVVNIIPRRSFDGVEAMVRYGAGDSFDERSAGIVWGKTWSDGQLMFAYETAERSALNGADRDFYSSDLTSRGGGDYRITRCPLGTLTAGGISYAIPQGGLTDANVGSLVAGTANYCDTQIGQDLLPKQSYNTMNMTYTQRLNETVEIFADAFLSKREYERAGAYNTATLSVPESNAFFVRPDGFAGSAYTIDYNFANDGRGNGYGHAKSYQITPGIRFNLGGDWRLEMLAGIGRTHDSADGDYGLDNAALNAALASSDPATAFDPYGLGRTSASTLATIFNQTTRSPTIGRLRSFESRVDGTLFSLPGGAVKLATGYEHQKIEVSLGSGRGLGGIAPVTLRHFDRSVSSGYAELLVPVFGAGNAVPGFQKLDINMAIRYDKYSDVGDTTNPKIGISWKPVEDLTLRGSWGTSFRAPILTQVYGNDNAFYGQNYQNPNGGAPILGFARNGTNMDLKPEEAETWSVGADWRVMPNLRLSLTYFDVFYENQIISYIGDLAILTREEQFAGLDMIVHGAAAGERVAAELAEGVRLAGGSFPGGDPLNVTLYVDGRNKNLGLSHTKGIDFQVNYSLPTDDYGYFSAALSGTYLTEFTSAITKNSPRIDMLNTIYNPLRLKTRAVLSWEKGDWTTRLVASHVNGYKNNIVSPSESVDAYTPIDLSVSWALGQAYPDKAFGNLTVTLEARNIFDVEPPFVNVAQGPNGSGGFDATAANPIGRTVGISLRSRW